MRLSYLVSTMESSAGQGHASIGDVEDWIVTNPAVLGGKPCVRGTRISVELVLELLASGASREDILHAYPQLTTEGLSAAIYYAARSLKNEVVWDVKLSA